MIVRNTTNVTVDIDWPWLVNPIQPPRPWWGALLSWVDVHLNHPLVLHARWPRWIHMPQSIFEAIPFARPSTEGVEAVLST